MPMKFINILETSKQQIRGQFLDSFSYVLLHFLTLRLFKNLAPGLSQGWKNAVFCLGAQCDGVLGKSSIKKKEFCFIDGSLPLLLAVTSGSSPAFTVLPPAISNYF